MSISFLLHMILNYCGYLTLLPMQPTGADKEKNQTNTKNLIKTERNSMKNMVISSPSPLCIKEKNLWLLTHNDISWKKASERGDRQEKGWEKWDNHHTMPERLWEVIVLQRMSSFPTCSVKYLPNYLLILTRRSLLIIWPDQHYYHFYELPLLLARWGLISDLTKVILILWIWWNNTFLQWIISPPNHFCPLPQGVLKTAQQPLY